MTTWTDESKQAVIDQYNEAEPTPGNSTEIVKQIANDMSLSPNAVRMVLIQAGVYVKKDETAASGTAGEGKAKGKSTGPKKASKEELHAALVAAIEEKGGTADMDIIGKMTGKAAEYFTSVLVA